MHFKAIPPFGQRARRALAVGGHMHGACHVPHRGTKAQKHPPEDTAERKRRGGDTHAARPLSAYCSHRARRAQERRAQERSVSLQCRMQGATPKMAQHWEKSESLGKMHVHAPTVKTSSTWPSRRPRAGVGKSVSLSKHMPIKLSMVVRSVTQVTTFLASLSIRCAGSMLHTPLPGKGKGRRAYLVVVVVGRHSSQSLFFENMTG